MRQIAFLALVLFLSSQTGAMAFDWGQPYAKLGLELGMDDHISGRETADPSTYPNGNRDANGTLSVGLGDEFMLDPDRSLTLSARLRGIAYALYPAFSGGWGSLSLEYAHYGLWGDGNLFGSLNGGTDLSGRSGGGSLTFEVPIPLDLTAGSSLGAYRYAATTSSDHTGLWLELSLRRRLGPVSLTAAYSYVHRSYDLNRLDRQHGATLYLSWRVMNGWYLKTSVEQDWSYSSDATRTFQGSLLNLGSVYYLF